MPVIRDEPPTERALSPAPKPPARRPTSDVENTQFIPALPAAEKAHDGWDDWADGAADEGTERDRAPAARPRRVRKGLLITVGAVVLVLAVGAGVVFTQPTVAAKLGLSKVAGTTTSAPPSPVAYHAQLKPPDDSAQRPSAGGVEAALAGSLHDPSLGTLYGTVLDAATGDVLLDRASSTAVAPASTNKILTSAAALLALGPQTTLNTRVVAGSDPGTIVLVGGGDPTLSSLPAPKQSVYPGAARMSDLAAQVKAHATGSITKIVVDTSLFSGPDRGTGWDPETASQDNYAPIESVMLDGGRKIPTKPDTPRTYQPALFAGQTLADDLGVPVADVSVTATPTPTGAAGLGEVHSAPLPDLVANLLQISDNVLAEELGRAVAIADHQPPTFAGASAAVLDVLRRNKFDTTGAILMDNSGLSPSDKVPTGLLAQVLRVAASADTSDPRVVKLRPVLLGLPIAGSHVGNATLENRYQTAPSSAGRGWVRAKTGTLTDQGVNALAGVVLDSSGRVLVFALNASGSTAEAPNMLDDLAAALRGCGCG